MKKRLFSFLGHFVISFLIIVTLVVIGVFIYKPAISKAALTKIFRSQHDYITNDNLTDDGPYLFEKKDSGWQASYFRKDGKEFIAASRTVKNGMKLPVYYYPDTLSFNVGIRDSFPVPAAEYEMPEKIVVISDIEGKFKAFKDFLLSNKVIDEEFNWIFGEGHLVCLGDFIDRGYFDTQVLWLIHHLENQVAKRNGKVHFILGNHEIMNLYGSCRYSEPKYFKVAENLGIRRYELYGENSYLGKWLRSKNSVERIGSLLFVHGGLHPDFLDYNHDLADYNEIIRNSFNLSGLKYKYQTNMEELLLSSRAPYWYRGYFSGEITADTFAKICKKFACKRMIVGHTPQTKVKTYFDDKLIAIDVFHPDDKDKWTFPKLRPQGLMIKEGEIFKVTLNQKKPIK